MSNPPPSSESTARPVETEIVQRLPNEGGSEHGQHQAGGAAEPSEPSSKSFFHPGSGLAIIGIDVAAFGINVPTGFLLTFLVALGAFVSTFVVVFGIQKQQAGDTTGWATLKALIGAVAAGIPMPIAGTVLGAAILMLSGLPNSTSKALGKLGR